MNTAEMINMIDQTEDTETTTTRSAALPKPAQSVSAVRATRLHHALLLGIVVLAGWLAVSLLNSNRELNAELDKVQADMALPLFHH